MSDARLTEYVAQLLAQRVSPIPPAEAAELRRLMAAWPRVEHLPFWSAMWVAGGGEVWIAAAPDQWVVLDAHGGPIAELTSPPGFTPFDFNGDLVIGRHADDLGVQSVRAYRLAH